MRIAIIGAGISGLATAFWIRRARPDWSLTVYEAEPQAGGTLHTDVIDGFRIEAGCNGFLTNKRATLDLVSASGADGLLMASSALARKRFLYDGALHRLPESPPAFLKSRLLSLGGKLRVAGELFVKACREHGDETLQSFGYRRLGREFTDVFLDAMTAGIYGSSPDRLAVAAAFPLVAALERDYGGLFRGMIAKRRGGAGPGGVLTSFTGGVSTFIDHLASTLDATWHLGTPVAAVTREGALFAVEAPSGRETFDRVIVATPAHAATHLLSQLDAPLAARLADVRYSPIAVVGLGYDHLAHPLEGFGVLSTSRSRLPVLGILWDSSVFPDRAPPGARLLRVMVGGQRDPEAVALDDTALIARAREGIRLAMGIDATPRVTTVRRWTRGIPNYGPGHLANVAAIDAAVATIPGLFLNSNAYHGVAMNDCCENARRVAERVLAS
jgi:oxygen-dependent protoporphyrinogen oxidase